MNKNLNNFPLSLSLKDSSVFVTHSHYHNLWASAQASFRSLITEEKEREPTSGFSRKQLFPLLLETFFKYLQCYKQIDEAYDQIVHPQKRRLIRKVLDLLLIRLLELRSSLVNVESSEFFYCDEMVYSDKVLPSELDVPIPHYYYHDPLPHLVQRDEWFRSMKERKIKMEKEKRDTQVRIRMQLSIEERMKLIRRGESEGGGSEEGYLEDEMGDSSTSAHYVNQGALIILQTVERARQGKLRFRLAKYLYDEAKMRVRKLEKVEVKMEKEKAVVIMQKTVRGFLARTQVKKMRDEELELLGLKWISPRSYIGQVQGSKWARNKEKLEESKEQRREQRRQNEKLFEDAESTILNKIRTMEAPDMSERLKSEVRNWILSMREVTGKLPELPRTQYCGESGFMIMDGEEQGFEQKPRDKGGKSKGTSDQASSSKKKSDKKKASRKKAVATALLAATSSQPNLLPPSLLDDMISANVEYNKTWRGRTDVHNPDQTYEEVFIYKEKRQLIGEEVREQVDLALKAELQLMKHAMEKRKGKKGKKTKGRRKGRRKGKKKGKKKKGKDMTPDRTMESLFEELVENGVIKNVPQTRLDSLIGPCSLINGELRSHFDKPRMRSAATNNEEFKNEKPGDANPLPSFGDVKRTIQDVCILPLGSKFVHENSPFTKSVLICGPEMSGKKTIVNAICTELHATLFDLTAANIVGKYPGKLGLKMLMHLVEKVGRALAPTIIKIESCEKTYAKKVAKTDKTEPRRLKRQLGKMLKAFVPGDQMLLIGLSSEPWQSNFKIMKKDYHRIIYIPKPDFGTRMEIWRVLLHPFNTYLHQDVQLSVLSKLSDGWTGGVIKRAVEIVVKEHEERRAKEQHAQRFMEDDPLSLPLLPFRKSLLAGKRLIRLDHFLDELSNHDPVFVEQDKHWGGWFNKTPLQRARLSLQTGIGMEENKMMKGKKKKKGAKGKGKKKGKK